MYRGGFSFSTRSACSQKAPRGTYYFEFGVHFFYSAVLSHMLPWMVFGVVYLERCSLLTSSASG